MPIRNAAILGFAVAATAAAGPMSEWNLIVRNNLVTTSEVDGSALIGGNLTGTSNYAVQGVTATNGDGLAIAGDIGAGINVQINDGGNLRIGGTAFGAVNLNGGGVVINDAGVSGMVSSAFAQMSAASAYLSSLPANGSLSGAGALTASPAMIGGQLVAVYNLMQSDFDGLGQLTLAIGAADSVIINVMADMNGEIDLIAPPNILSDFSQANSSRILWNFFDADIVNINNSFSGALLAPGADLRLSGGGINGSVVVDNISQMDAEIRRFNYTGFIPAPGAAATMLLGGLVAARRRRTAA